MQSRWSDREAAEYVDRFAPAWGEELALRVYTSRLIGRDPDLVLHGGGNTSLKGTVRTLVGDEVEASVRQGQRLGPRRDRAAGTAGCRSRPSAAPARAAGALRRGDGEPAADAPLRRRARRTPRSRRCCTRSCRIASSTTPTPTRSSLTNQRATGEAMVARGLRPALGGRSLRHAGLRARQARRRGLRARPAVEGLVLLKHGLFTFADDARTATSA